MARVWNFSAGPSALPETVLAQAAAEMLDWRGCGMSVMEMSHRSPQFGEICDTAEADLRELLAIPDDYAVLFMQGGATAENAIVPLNLIARRGASVPGPAADFVVSGHWSARSYTEAQRYGDAAIAATNEVARVIDGVQYAPRCWLPAPETWNVRPHAAYLHLCSNETIGGVELADWSMLPRIPDVPQVIDASSHFLSRPLDVTRAGMVYAGAQKNAGPAGVTVVIVHRDLLGSALPTCPSAFDYSNVARERSRYNTPPTYAIYVAGLVFQWLKEQGGLAAIEAANLAKARLLYNALDASDFYRNPVHPPARSRMNVPFVLADPKQANPKQANPKLDADFLAGAEARGLSQLKGHKSVGGMRASIYNATPIAAVAALVDYLQDFERRHG